MTVKKRTEMQLHYRCLLDRVIQNSADVHERIGDYRIVDDRIITGSGIPVAGENVLAHLQFDRFLLKKVQQWKEIVLFEETAMQVIRLSLGFLKWCPYLPAPVCRARLERSKQSCP